MSRRLIKELRPLLLPGGIAAIAAVIPVLLSPFGYDGVAGEALAVLRGVGFFTFVVSVALLACLPFGIEIHERTFPLLLSQPLKRIQLWAEKLLAAIIAIALVAWLQSWTNWHNNWWGFSPLSRWEELVLGVFFSVTICAGCFWTLVGRSIIGGVAFTLASQLLLVLASGFVLERIGYDYVFEWIHDPIGNVRSPIPAFLVVGTLYGGLLLWLGWREFAKLELKGSSFGEGTPSEASQLPGLWWSSWLRSRPKGYLANLVRKELRLQKPVLLIAGLVSLCWLATLGLSRLTPAHKDFFEGTANVLTGVFMVLMPLLAGCISLGEEKTLGLSSWQLTLPVSARKQWAVKLAVAAAVAISLGLILPYLLAWLSASTMDTGLAQALRDSNRQEAWLTSLTVVGLPFLLGFWAATLLGNTVRSALMAIASLLVLFACAALGAWCASTIGGVETPLLRFIIAHFQLTGESSHRAISSQTATVVGYSCAALGITLLLAQSLAQFRRARVQSRTIAYYAAAIAGFMFLAAFWVVDIQMSHAQAWMELKSIVANALQALPASDLGPGRFQAVSLAELEKTGALTPAAKTWLRGASITIQSIGVKMPNSRVHSKRATDNKSLVALIRFPNGQQEFVGPYEGFEVFFSSPPPR